METKSKPEEEGRLRIRGHHLFDMLEALVTGKSAHKTLGPVAQKILANPNIPIKVVVGVDDICAPCEYWDHVQGFCVRYPKEEQEHLDKSAIRVLGTKEGDAISASDLYSLLKKKVSKRIFVEEVCKACKHVNKCKETYEQNIEAAVKALRGRA